jgi:hypothetical protein
MLDNPMIFPISFSIPRQFIVDAIPEKTKVLATCIPGKPDTYVFDTQDDYYADYRKSMFALTTVKGGWDCYRHYEILANGCIPLFPALETCPSLTMTTLPKQLILDANTHISANPASYQTYAEQLLAYTREHLTTRSAASRLLSYAGMSTARSVLFISISWPCGVDYLRCLTLHGLKEALGAECHDYPRVDHLYTDYTGDCNALWGRGYGCSKLLEPSMRDGHRDSGIEDDIRNKRYDCIVYGSVHRGLPLWDLVRASYASYEVIMMCGEDFHTECPLSGFQNDGHPCFQREIPV